MELCSYAIMLVLTNVMFAVREVYMIIELKNEENKSALKVFSYSDHIQTVEYVMSCAGFGGSILATTFLLLILKPVYKSM